MKERSNLVFTTEKGRIEVPKEVPKAPKGDSIVRISLRRLGGNKSVSVVNGLGLESNELKQMCRELKQKCGAGGTVKAFDIEIQGDKRSTIQAELEKKGYKVKLSGS